MISGGRLLRSLVTGSLGGGRRGRRRRRRMRRASGLGGVATGAIGMGALGVAIAAFEHFTQKKPASGQGAPIPPPPPAGNVPPPPIPAAGAVTPPPLPVPTQGESGGDEALVLVRAMIAAANADHELDADERARIVQALVDADCSDEERGFVLAEMERPWPLAKLVEAATTPELAREVYLASFMTIEVDSEAERNYLERLAARLGLDAETVTQLESMIEPDDGDPSQASDETTRS